MAANIYHLTAGLPVAKDSGQSPSSGVNTVYLSAGLPPEPYVALSLTDYPDVTNESPYANDESIVTVAASGGSTPYSYKILSQVRII